MERIIKYPRTEHLEGSGIQVGDEDLNQIPFSEILGKNIVVEEKIDGANVGISFQGGNLLLQSRGHYLSGGYKERHYDLFKIFGAQNRDTLYSVLGEIQQDVHPDSLEVHDKIAVVAAVGRRMAFRPGTSGKVFAALGQAGINIRMINQGPDELNIIFGVDNKDFQEAIRVLYNSFVK